jgi:magnesium-transporting ATPase (P-type)
LERLAGIDMVVFDKTGTLTQGRGAVRQVCYGRVTHTATGVLPHADDDGYASRSGDIGGSGELPVRGVGVSERLVVHAVVCLLERDTNHPVGTYPGAVHQDTCKDTYRSVQYIFVYINACAWIDVPSVRVVCMYICTLWMCCRSDHVLLCERGEHPHTYGHH